MWWSAFIFTLAKGRVTKEFEEWVLWELPLARAFAYQHCALRSSGQWTVPMDRPISEKFTDLQEKKKILSYDEDEEVVSDDFDT